MKHLLKNRVLLIVVGMLAAGAAQALGIVSPEIAMAGGLLPMALGETADLDSIKEILQKQGEAFEQFKQANDAMIKAKADGKSVEAYGAAAKGNTFLNYAGVTPADIVAVFDANPHKQDRFLPGTHIPVHAPAMIAEFKPDYVVILPWNLKDEITKQMADIRAWGGKFVVPMPQLQVID